MEYELAMKLLELEQHDLEEILTKLKMENVEAYDILVELVDDKL